MTSTIKVNTITTESGSTLTVGGCGKTVALASGASQTGFGRTGTVDWNTTKKTANFTATNGAGFFVDTNSGTITATLPASPSAGNIVAIKDYQGTFGTNKCTVDRNGSNIRGAASNFDLARNNAGAVFIYVDATEGWQVFVDGSDDDAVQSFISATGGTVSCSGNFKIHTFTGPGTFCVSSVGCVGVNDLVDFLVIAGGGGGGSNGGGGGAGGYRFSDGSVSGCFTTAPGPIAPLGRSGITVTRTAFPITVGGGGPGSTPCFAANRGGQGSTSTFSTISSAGGGGGGSQNTPVQLGGSGGSGGGGGQSDTSNPNYPGGCSQGAGNTPPVSPPQGNPGGKGSTGGTQGGAGGGSIAAAGGNATPDTSPSSTGGIGAAGIASCITASPVTRGGGGGGSGAAGQGAGGAGGGGAAGNPSGSAGTANTGGGGGGSHPTSHAGGAGGSGVVIIRYRFQ